MSFPCWTVRQSDLAKQKRESKTKIHFGFETYPVTSFGKWQWFPSTDHIFIPGRSQQQHKGKVPSCWPWCEQWGDSWDGQSLGSWASQQFAESFVFLKKLFKFSLDSRRNFKWVTFDTHLLMNTLTSCELFSHFPGTEQENSLKADTGHLNFLTRIPGKD